MNAPSKRQNPPGVAGSESAGLGKQLQPHPNTRQYPRKGTASAEVLAALRRGQRLTSRDAWQAFGTSRLAVRVHELRRMGWPVVAMLVTVSTRNGHLGKVARYHLPEAGGGFV